MRGLLFLMMLLAMPSFADEPSFRVIAYHDVRDDVVGDYDPDQYAVSTSNLITQFTWLREQGFQPISVDDIIAAENGGTPLPERAVLLTFDDGLQSFYTKVYPLLKLFRPITPSFLVPALVPLYVAWFFYMFRFYVMPWALGYSVMGMLSFPLESEIGQSVAWLVGKLLGR